MTTTIMIVTAAAEILIIKLVRRRWPSSISAPSLLSMRSSNMLGSGRTTLLTIGLYVEINYFSNEIFFGNESIMNDIVPNTRGSI